MSKHNLLLSTSCLEIAGAVNTAGMTNRVTTVQGASRVVDRADMLIRGLAPSFW